MNNHRSIFRAAALQRYAQGQERAVLPPIIAPKTFAALWGLLFLLVLSGVLAWHSKVPLYISGQAIFIRRPANLTVINTDVVLIAVLPAEQRTLLRKAQPMFLKLGNSGQRLRLPIIAVDRTISSPAVLQQRFELPLTAAATITQPSVVAIIGLDSFPAELPLSTYLGSRYQIEIEIGSRRVLALMPLLGHFFEESQ